MRSILTVFVAALSVIGAATGRASAQNKAEIVSTLLVSDRAPRSTYPDLIHFGDRWFLACLENTEAGRNSGAIRVLTSADGKKWDAAARIESPTPQRSLGAPSLGLAPDGGLMVSALAILPFPNSADPLPEYGGLLKTLAWFSKDGRTWGEPLPIGADNFPFGRLVKHNGTTFGYAFGRICGSAQTIHISASKNGKAFEPRFAETFRGFMPYEAELFFEGDKAWCVMNRSMVLAPEGKSGLLGTAKAPYTAWEWKDMDQRIREPKLIRLPDKRVIATVGLFDRKIRTSLCEFDPSTGRFTELLELPTGGQAVAAGLAWHDGHVWVSYPVAEEGQVRVHLAKVKLK